MSDAIESFVSEAMKREADAVEAMCERMLVTPGDWGVLVESWWEGDEYRTRVSLSQDVEPMTVTYSPFPTRPVLR